MCICVSSTAASTDLQGNFLAGEAGSVGAGLEWRAAGGCYCDIVHLSGDLMTAGPWSPCGEEAPRSRSDLKCTGFYIYIFVKFQLVCYIFSLRFLMCYISVAIFLSFYNHILVFLQSDRAVLSTNLGSLDWEMVCNLWVLLLFSIFLLLTRSTHTYTHRTLFFLTQEHFSTIRTHTYPLLIPAYSTDSLHTVINYIICLSLISDDITDCLHCVPCSCNKRVSVLPQKIAKCDLKNNCCEYFIPLVWFALC